MADTDDTTTDTGADETDDTTATTDDAKDTGTDGKDTDADDKPASPAELKALRDKLKKANQQAAAHRREADELKRKGETDQEAAMRAAREEAEKTAEETWKPRLVRTAARAALAEAGLVGKPDRLLKLIDSDRIEIDEDDVTGLDEQIREIKKDYPEMFTKRGSSRIDGADRGGDTGGKVGGLSSTSARLLAQSRAS